MMKRIVFVLLGVVLVLGLGLYLKERNLPAVPPAEPEPAPAPPQAEQAQPFSRAKPASLAATEPRLRPSITAAAPVPAANGTETNAPLALEDAIALLISPQSTFEQKQKVWREIRDKVQVDQAINELEQRWTNQPRDAELPAALGQAYLKKAGMTQDIREQAILGMKADKAFEDALVLDPSNWEARFTKAVGMSYWPATLNRGQDVIEQFQTLIQQQEAQAPQPEFAQSYRWLGEQYQKAGQTDEARKVWERGATLFPDNDELKKRLAKGQ
jgi:tetratricopeptide (TPR) repeat protein